MGADDEPDVLNAVDMRGALNMNEYADDIGGDVLRVMRICVPRLPVLLRLARSQETTSHWLISEIATSDIVPDGEVIASVQSSWVRTYLAFFGATITRNQLYGGHIHRLIHVDGTAIRAVIYMSNFNAVGWWLRAYLFRMPERIGA